MASFDWLKARMSAESGQLAQRITAKVNTYHVPGCNASRSYDRWCGKHGFLNHSNSVGRFVFFSLILPYFLWFLKRVYSVIMLSMNSSSWSYFFVLFCIELRKKARQLENEIDLKLVSFSKLGTNFSHRDGFKERYISREMKRHGFYHLRIWLVISIFCLQFWYVTTFKQFFEWSTFRNYGTRNWGIVNQGLLCKKLCDINLWFLRLCTFFCIIYSIIQCYHFTWIIIMQLRWRCQNKFLISSLFLGGAWWNSKHCDLKIAFFAK